MLLKLGIYVFLAFILRFNILLAFRGSSSPSSGLIVGASIAYCALFIFVVELAFGTGRIFRAEIQAKTLAGLLGLPIPVRRIAYQKVGALLLGAAPALIISAAAATYVSVNHPHDLSKALGSKYLWLSVFYTGAQGLLFLHLIAYLSLYLKRLSLAVAVVLMFMGNAVCGALAGIIIRSSSSSFILTLYHCGLLALAAFLHVKIGNRLKQLAAMEG